MPLLNGSLPLSAPMSGQLSASEEALYVFSTVLPKFRLNKVQRIVLCESWLGTSYPEIATKFGYDPDYIKDVGYRLWQTLSKDLGETISKNSLRFILTHRFNQLQNLQLETESPFKFKSKVLPNNFQTRNPVGSKPHYDWGGAGEPPVLEGREAELRLLNDWILDTRCRLIGIFGLGGVGKTAIAIRIAETLKNEFDYLIWRSLRNAPPFEQTIDDLLSCFPEYQGETAATPDSKIVTLIDCLNQHRCLLILDNWTSVLQANSYTGVFQKNYEQYGQLMRQIGQSRHQSCLIITSREQPGSTAFNEGQASPIRSLKLAGLDKKAGIKFLRDLGLTDLDKYLGELNQYYEGNPLALKIVTKTIQDLFEGNVSEFLQYEGLIYGGVRNLIEQQLQRLSPSEIQLMQYLARDKNQAAISELQEYMAASQSQEQTLETVESLYRRSLLQKQGTQFTQTRIIREYILQSLKDKGD